MYLLSVDRLVHIAEDLGLTDGLIFAVYGQVLGLVELPKWAVHLLFTILILFKNLEPAAQLQDAAEVHVKNGVEEILLTFMSLVWSKSMELEDPKITKELKITSQIMEEPKIIKKLNRTQKMTSLISCFTSSHFS